MLFSFLVRKLISISLTFFLLITVCFFLLRILPGSPFDEGKFLSPEIEHKMQEKYGLDKPLQEQYQNYLEGIFKRCDLGPSLKYTNRDVNQIIIQALPVSLILGLIAFSLALLVGVLGGVIAALNNKNFLGNLIDNFSALILSMPGFVFAALLIFCLGIKSQLLPVALWEGPKYAILPALTLAITPTAYILRITKTAMLDNLSKPHVRMAQAKGLSRLSIIYKHCFLNSLSGILTIIGPIFALLITGSFVVEHIFALPGIGKYFVTAFINRDYFLVSGVVIVFAFFLLIANTLIDLAILYLNPKIK